MVDTPLRFPVAFLLAKRKEPHCFGGTDCIRMELVNRRFERAAFHRVP